MMPMPQPPYPNQPPMPMQPMPIPEPLPPKRPNDMSRGFATAGIILAVIAAFFALIPLWDRVSVFGVIGLALDVIAACSLFSDENRTPVWVGVITVAAVLCVASILVVALT
ncbi:hypothetical protein [Bifidobacterium sp. SO1]|uniref:hypothetical protein n=1 Tax=Bifidobacterium sp. SO1 TaxID=2809029 RepID=UPI001BDDBC63|nr:hypothetical protein [Bifidobacterium sp. SO1]MBT1162106.1 hypothetical protein [Bifidobacterium sp. SO1]